MKKIPGVIRGFSLIDEDLIPIKESIEGIGLFDHINKAFLKNSIAGSVIK